jgi:hypothetical protein
MLSTVLYSYGYGLMYDVNDGLVRVANLVGEVGCKTRGIS